MSENPDCISSKRSLRGAQMSEAYLTTAQGWASFLINREARGPGDIENAMRRVEAKRGISFSVLWGLKYRPPKDVMVSTFFALKNAYLAVCEEEKRRLEDAIERTKKSTGLTEDDSLAIRAAVALVDAADE